MRDQRIDLLRFIGLSMIIFAHVGPPGLLFQLRNFDVPLMVLISGMSYGLSYRETGTYTSYLWKRFKRLVLPVWLFLTAYFLSIYFVNNSDPQVNVRTVFDSFVLLGGIGYVWIIRVFLIVALIAPFIYKIDKSIESTRLFYLFVIVAFFSWEVLRYISYGYINQGFLKYITLVTHYAIPYGLVYLLGLRMLVMSNRALVVTILSALFILVTYGIILYVKEGHIVLTQAMKYPPSVYYLSYAIFVSALLWLFAEKILNIISYLRFENIMLFISQNSIWIYLWHIPFIKYLDTNFVAKYGCVYIGATCIAFLQVWLVSNVLIPKVRNKTTIKNIKMILTG